MNMAAIKVFLDTPPSLVLYFNTSAAVGEGPKKRCDFLAAADVLGASSGFPAEYV